MTLLFNGSFQQGDHWIDQNHFSSVNYGNIYNSCIRSANGLVVVPSPAGHTGLSGKFRLDQGQTCNSFGTDERSMLSLDPPLFQNVGVVSSEGDDRYYSLSMYFPSDFQADSWLMFWQILPPPLGYPTISIYYDYRNDRIFFGIRAGGTKMGSSYKELNFDTLHRGEWHDYVFHIIWSTSNEIGKIEVYKNGVKTASMNTATLNTDAPQNNMAFGLYRGTQPYTQTVYFSNIKIGTARADVEYTGSQPPTCPQATLNMII